MGCGSSKNHRGRYEGTFIGGGTTNINNNNNNNIYHNNKSNNNDINSNNNNNNIGNIHNNTSSDYLMNSNNNNNNNNAASVVEQSSSSIIHFDDINFNSCYNSKNGYTLSDIYEDIPGEQYLGEGQFGYVSKRYHVETRNAVAVKLTKPTILDRKNNNNQPLYTYNDICTKCMEIRTLLKLQNNNNNNNNNSNNNTYYNESQHVLQIYEIFWNCNIQELNIVTELLSINLREWLSKQDTFTEQQAKIVSLSILHGLHYMHTNNIVHRDIKEDNIMFKVPPIHNNNNNDDVYDLSTLTIVDFGFAKEFTSEHETSTEICGSLGYLAPEIYLNEPYHTKVDMFSFGVLLFRILSAEKPWPAAPSAATRQATIQLQYKIDRRQWLLVSHYGKDLIRKLLSYTNDRITAAEALQHNWFDEDIGNNTSPSILQNDAHAFFPDGARAGIRSRAIIDDDNNNEINNQYIAEQQQQHSGQRFWMDQSMEYAIRQLLSTNDFHGRIISVQEGFMMVEEYLYNNNDNNNNNNNIMILPYYIAKQIKYTELTCRNIFKQILLRIQSFHNSGLVHRNLHPSNIIVKQENVGDDGFYVSIRGIQYAQLSSDQITGRVGHTTKKFDWFAYVAPEIDTDFVHDSRVDLWSLGAILYTLLCGIGPFTGTGKQILNKKNNAIIQFDIIQPSDYAQQLVRKLLQKNPNNRISIYDILNNDPWMNFETDDELDNRHLDLALAMFGDYGKKMK